MEARMTDAIQSLKHAWEVWDVRAMIVLSAFIQILLFLLGNRRKYMVSPSLKILVWIAYLSADWVATAALGKLSSNFYVGSKPNNFLCGIWASALLMHMGGPDTITAYALEDNQLWTRHLLSLLIQAALAVYVICLSWTRSWLSLLNFPLFIAGIIKYFKRTWSLYRASGKNPGEKPPLFNAGFVVNFSEHPTNMTDAEHNLVTDPQWFHGVDTDVSQIPPNLTDAEKILMAHQWFSWTRPDRNNYLSVNDRDCTRGRSRAPVDNVYPIMSLRDRTPIDCLVDIVTIELGITFDMLYAKVAIIYTKLGCILRLISFFCILFALVLITTNRKANESSPRDMYITQSLLVVAVGLELYGLFLIVSSDWFVVLKIIYRDPKKCCLLRGILKIIDWLSSKVLQQKKKRWSSSVGQFNLFAYCISFRKRKYWVAKMLQKIGIEEMLAKHWQTSVLAVPRSFLNSDKFFSHDTEFDDDFDLCTKGEKTLRKEKFWGWEELRKDVKDLDQSIIIYHILTDILYSIQKKRGSVSNESITKCKAISDYMMYILVMKPHMISSDESIWFESFSSHLRKVLLHEHDEVENATASTIFDKFQKSLGHSFDDHTSTQFSPLLKPVLELEKFLRSNPQKWDILSSVWIEIVKYAAINCPHACHLQELRQGGELLSLCWLLLNTGQWYTGNKLRL